jgi:predicted transcriptional regulator
VLDKEHILISLNDRHAENILSGRKQVELRRRTMNVESGTIIWIYVKLPVGSIVGCAKVVNVHSSSPSTLWRRFGSVSGLSRSEFFDYFKGVTRGVALELEGAERLHNSLSLEEIREIYVGFQPPQFFARLNAQHPIIGAIKTNIAAL